MSKLQQVIGIKTRRESGVSLYTLLVFSILFCAIYVFAFVNSYYETLPVIHNTVKITITPSTIIPLDNEIKTTEKYAFSKFTNTYFTRVQNAVSLNKNTTAQKKANAAKTYVDTPAIIPINYTPVDFLSNDEPIYLFVDDNGVYQYRVFARRILDGKESNGFLKAKMTVKDGSLTFDYDLDDDFVSLDSENFAVLVPKNAPKEETQGLIKVYGITGLYYKINDNGKYEYYSYGQYPNGIEAFYVADYNGNSIPGALPINFKEE